MSNPLRDAVRAIRDAEHDAVVGAFLECLPEDGIARRFVAHYAYEHGHPWRLRIDEMADCNAAIDLYANDHPQFMTITQQMIRDQVQVQRAAFQGSPRAMTIGTLGGFTSRYEGTISFDSRGYAQFEGTMRWTDRWDFEPHTSAQQNAPSGRGQSGERLTWFGRNFLPGTAFDITSEVVPCSQNWDQRWLQWYGSEQHPPTLVNARATDLIGAEGVIGSDTRRSLFRRR